MRLDPSHVNSVADSAGPLRYVTRMSDTDLELLARYTRQHAEDAFAELVRRHVGLVYSAALRQVRSPQFAEEVAQSVFTDLARSAAKLKPDTILTAWLYQVTRRTAIDVVRREASRQLREQIATEMNAMNATAADWTHIEPLLDEAMHALDDTDRTAVLLRYFENKSLREVGATLGTSENAAQKRLSRAVERLREFFAKRGVTVGASGLVVVISANAVQAAPAALAQGVTVAAMATGSVTGASNLILIQTLKLMAWTKFKTVALVGTALLLFGGTTAVIMNQTRNAALSVDQKAVTASVESLVNALARGDADAFTTGLHTRNDAERRLAASAGMAAKGMADLNAALVERFGDTDDVWRIRHTFCIVSCIPLLGYQGQQTKVEVRGDDAFYRPAKFNHPTGPGFPLHFVRTNGDWKLLMDEKPPSDRAAEIGVPGTEGWARQHHEFAKEIRAGRFASPLEAWLALTKQHGWKGYTNLPQPLITRSTE